MFVISNTADNKFIKKNCKLFIGVVALYQG